MNLLAQNPYIQNYNMYVGLPSNNIYHVYEDSKNLIWFATDAGIVRYDGSSLFCYSKKDGLNSNEILKIKEDSQGRIWLFNLNGTMNYYYQNKIYNNSNAPFLDSLQSKHFFRDFYQDTNLTIYFYTHQSLEIFSLNTRNQVKKYTLPSKAEKYSFNDFEVERMNVYYISKSKNDSFLLFTGSGIYNLHDFSQEPRMISEKYGFSSCFKLNENKCWFQGYYKSDTNKLNFIYTIDVLSTPFKIPIHSQYHFTSVIETNNGIIWIATYDRGVFLLKKDSIINYFDFIEAQAMMEDHEGNVWVSTLNNGVYKISPFHDAIYITKPNFLII